MERHFRYRHYRYRSPFLRRCVARHAFVSGVTLIEREAGAAASMNRLGRYRRYRYRAAARAQG